MTRRQIIYIFPYGFKYIKNICYIDTFLHVEAQAVFCIGALSIKEGRLPYAGKEGWLLGLEVISRFTTGEWRETTLRPLYGRGRFKPRQNLVYTSGYFIGPIRSAQSFKYQCLYVPDEPLLTIHMCNGDFGELWDRL